jgi:predicted Zn-dependent protease with MMP-like domain
MALSDQLRDYFDEQLESVVEELPATVHRLLDEVPMYVEDFPSHKMMRDLGIRHRSNLCGLYTGIPLGSRRVDTSGVMSDVIYIFREGVMSLATDHRGKIDQAELRRQIRITILHELGHHHGLDEDELEAMGY